MDLVWISIAALLFVGTHLGVSSSGLRDRVIGAVGGQQIYLAVYSLISFITLGLLIWAYVNVAHGPALWTGLNAIATYAVMPLALFFLIGGFLVPNPTAVGQDGAMGEQSARGLLRITRHPVMWGFSLWAFAHMLANGDLNSLVFFGSFLVVAGYGMVLIDRRKAAAPNWNAFANATSVIPFAAIRAGRNHLLPQELIVPAIAALILFVLLLWAHPYVSGGMVIA